MEDFGLTCSVCEEQYSEDRVPRNLGCGHSLCTSCTAQVLARDKKCPECRRVFSAASATQLAVNYPLLKLARSFGSSRSSHSGKHEVSTTTHSTSEPQTSSADANAPVASSSSRAQPPDAGECSAHGSRRLYFRCMRCNVWICHECIASSHLDPPVGQCRTVPLTQALAEMKRSHIQTSTSKIQFAEKLKRRIEKEATVLGAMREQKASTMASLLTVLEEVEAVTGEVDARKEAALGRLSEVRKVLEELKQTEARVEEARTAEEVSSAVEMVRMCLEEVDRCFLREQQLGHSSKMPTIVTLGKQVG